MKITISFNGTVLEMQVRIRLGTSTQQVSLVYYK